MSLPSSLEEWNRADESNLSTITNCLCPSCQEYGAVTLCLPSKVPYFREIIIMQLTCDCGFRNSEVTFGGELQPKGVRSILTVTSPADLNRQVIKSDSCTISLPSIEFEIPPITQRGSVTTLEGVITKAYTQLQDNQAARAIADINLFTAVQGIIEKLTAMCSGTATYPFTVTIDDPAGNSYIENPHAPSPDKNLVTSHYTRTPTQDMSIGLQPSAAAREAGTIDDGNVDHKNKEWSGGTAVDDDVSKLGIEEVMSFPGDCSGCGAPTTTNMCMTRIPHFKEVIIMSMDCDKCGFRSNEVKGGGAIPDFGTEVILKVDGPEDFGREILKSDTAGIAIPELDLELEEGSLDGIYSTVEGMLKKLRDNMKKTNPFGHGDSNKQHHLTNDGGKDGDRGFADAPIHVKYDMFLAKLDKYAEGKQNGSFTIIINDPLSNSFIGPTPPNAIRLALQAEEDASNGCYDNFVDPGLTINEYTRTTDQNEVLGLNDIKTEGYSAEAGIGSYGTDIAPTLSDRLADPHVRGPDHPFNVAMAPVGEGEETTKMGPGTMVMGGARLPRGKKVVRQDKEQAVEEAWVEVQDEGVKKREIEGEFNASSEWQGAREGCVFKVGEKGLGYYSDSVGGK